MKNFSVVNCLAVFLSFGMLGIGQPLAAQELVDADKPFARENLVAWCIVPFDSQKRGPEERAAMLKKLAFTKFAYDYRAEHIPTFDAEMQALKKQGIELTAWWFPGAMNDEARGILAVLKRHDLKPQLWVTGGGEPTKSAEEQTARVKAEAARIRPIAEAAAKIGCSVALYNHGGWFGEPENQLAIIAALDLPNVGIVYNQHHGHDHLGRFPELLKKMLPKLVCLNLNGMMPDGERRGQKILPLGQGELDLALLKTIRDSGYRGPIGILGHTQDDAELRLLDNLDGLDWLVKQLDGAPPAGAKPRPRTPVPAPVAPPAAAPAKKALNHWGKEVIGFDWQESDSVDKRWNETQIGPFLASIVPIPGQPPVEKGLSIRVGERGQATLCYDTGQATLRAGWTGGFLQFHPARYGLINSPAIAGQLAFASPAANWEGQQVRYLGLQLAAQRVVLAASIGGTLVRESPWLEERGGLSIFTRTMQVAPAKQPLVCTIGRFAGAAEMVSIDGVSLACASDGKNVVACGAIGSAKLAASNDQNRAELRAEFPSGQADRRAKILLWSGDRDLLPRLVAAIKQSPPPENLDRLAQPSAPQWKAEVVTQGVVGDDPAAPYVVDTLTLPFDNPYKALMFVGGHDEFANGDIAICTVHGDVWRVSGVDDELRRLVWRRFATGLFQPLGLKIVGDQVHVLGRDQITRLLDRNADGEADDYQCVTNQYPTSAGGHDYVTCLEADSAGRLHFVHATQGLLRIAKDGSVTTVATGFRNPNGMSIGPGDELTVSPQEGEWTPGSVIFEVRPGGHYGYGGPKPGHGARGYDLPLAWLPRLMDNSSGGQVWVTSDRWGPLGGQLLHLSFGKCRMSLVLREQIEGQTQGAVVELPLGFSSGIMRGRFSERDGQLYVSGLKGWASAAVDDGCLQRVRYTGRAVAMPVERATHANGLAITFSQPLERATAEDPGSYRGEQWNYRYAATYGSEDWKLSEANAEGHDPLPIRSATLLDDGRSVFLEIPNLRPAHQTSIEYSLRLAGGHPLRQTLVATTHVVPTQRMDEGKLHRPRPIADLVDESHLAPGVVLQSRQEGAPRLRIARLVAWAAEPVESASGFMKVPLRGEYRFHTTEGARARLRINGQVALDTMTGESDTPARALTLHQGYNRFELECAADNGDMSSGRLWWTDGSFALEPVPPTVLFHDARDIKVERAQRLRRGAYLASERRCYACHADSADPTLAVAAGPNLAGVGGRLSPSWIYEWLLDPAAIRQQTHMPRFFSASDPGDRQAAADLAAYLASLAVSPTVKDAETLAAENPISGAALFESLGCVACHRLTPAAESDPYDRLPLAHVAGKFQPGKLALFLLRPQAHFALTRMPDFALTQAEAAALAEHLSSAANLPATGKIPELANGDAVAGKALFQKHRCGACHASDPSGGPLTTQIERTPLLRATHGCLAERPEDRGNSPAFVLSADQRELLAATITNEGRSSPAENPVDLAPYLVQSLRCGACHNRDHAVAPLRRIVADQSESGLVPDSLPNLTWAGEKLHADWMEQMLAGQLPYKSRPWLAARMPAFPGYAEQLAAGLAAEHGIAPAGAHPDEQPHDSRLALVGDRLTRKGGGLDCRSCHAVGKDQPVGDDRTKVAPGINFAHTRARMRGEFYRRYLLDPPRYDITTRMPKLSADGRTTQATSILDGSAPRQFDAIWHFLQTVEP
ncbi:MAG: c-type cytochrome [Pirellulaceae bacterium]